MILAVIAGLARGGFGQIAEVRTLAPQYLIGGVLGACYVSTILVTVRTLGAGGVVAAAIAGQLDGVADRRPVRPARRRQGPDQRDEGVGVLLLAAGTLLVVRG